MTMHSLTFFVSVYEYEPRPRQLVTYCSNRLCCVLDVFDMQNVLKQFCVWWFSFDSSTDWTSALLFISLPHSLHRVRHCNAYSSRQK